MDKSAAKSLRRPDLANTVSGMDAYRTSLANEQNRFNFAAGDPNTAGWRMAQAHTVPIHVKPTFRLESNDTIFTMGSCFARHVEESLIRRGARVLLADFDMPDELFDPEHRSLPAQLAGPERRRAVRTVLNKYTPLSMQHAFERVLVPEIYTIHPQGGLVELSELRWYEPQLNNVQPGPLNRMLLARAIVESANAMIREATAVFLTLGFTESWWDAESNEVLSTSPPPFVVRRYPTRFRFFNATHAQVLDALESVHRLITKLVRPDMKFVITVSPVPLGVTFTEMDIITANAYSKATLRSAAGEFCARHENVDYFPSYEMVMATRGDLVWEDDWVHVRPAVVDDVIASFLVAYAAPA